MQKLSSAVLALFFPLFAVGGLVAFGGIGPTLPIPFPLVTPRPSTSAESGRKEVCAFPAQEAAAAQAPAKIRLWSARLYASGGADADATRNLSLWQHALAVRRVSESAARAALPLPDNARFPAHS